uniref:Uncharacterized protein n=1 Tax=Strongyloides venezuelensis TaxID=75913 RepID=A0A0K0EXB9_STRVS
MWVMKYTFIVIILQTSILLTKKKLFVSPQQTDIVQTAGDGARLVGDILKLLAENQQLIDKNNNDEIISSSKNDNILSSFNNLFIPTPQAKSTDKHSLGIENNINLLPNQQTPLESETWKVFANEMMNMFGLTTTTQPPPKSSNFFSNAIGKYINTINEKSPEKDTKTLFPMTAETQETLFGSWAKFFNLDSSNKRRQKIDTGNGNFDRIVVREKSDGGNFFENLVGTKWKERGLQWANGNLRLVNKNGKDVLGSEVAVHDKSIDIPVQQWFNIAENLLGNVRSQ